MKTAVIALALAVLLGGCVSGNPGARTDYVDPSFGSEASKQAARATEIRRMYPHLSEKQIAEKVKHEFPSISTASRRERERRAAQKIFEDELAAGRRMYDKAERGY